MDKKEVKIYLTTYYLDKVCKGNKSEFARIFGKHRQHITTVLNGAWRVIDCPKDGLMLIEIKAKAVI